MSAVSEPLYAGEQIHIPPELPEVLKQFTKAAIKTQPDNTYLWAAQYFEALAKGKQPPVKARLVLQRTKITDGEEDAGYDEAEDGEEDYDEGDDGYEEVTIDQLEQLATKLRGGPDEISAQAITEVCITVGFPEVIVEDVFGVGKFTDDACNWKHFVTLACASLPDTGDLTGSMRVAVSVLGTEGALPLVLFKESYAVLADLDPGITDEEKAAGLKDFEDFAAANDGNVTVAAFAAVDVDEATADGGDEGASQSLESLVSGLASGEAEVSKADVEAAARDAGVADDLVAVALRVGKFGDSIKWANFVALLIANTATSIEDTVEKMLALNGNMSKEDLKAAHEFIASLDASQTAEQIEARNATIMT